MRLLLISSTIDLQSISAQASVKNFQMEIEPDNVIMQFGRVGTDTFTMDFRWVDDIHKPLFMANIRVAFLCQSIVFFCARKVILQVIFFVSFNC